MQTIRHTDNLDAMSQAQSYQRALCRLLREKLGLRAGTGPFIDFGAGKGEYAAALTSTTEALILCIEPELQLHAQYPAGMGRRADLQQVRLAWAAGAYSLNVFEHIVDDATALRELAARVAVGGRILVLVPAKPSLWTPMDTAVGHVRRYTPQGLRELANNAGLLVRGEGWFDRTGYFATRGLQLLMQLGMHDRNWHGRVTPRQIKSFDLVFRLLEPLLERLNLPFGKNRWVLLEVPHAKNPRNA